MRMGKKGKWLVSMGFMLLLTMACAFPVMAGDIRNIYITFTDKYEEGVILEPEISCRTSNVSIESLTWSKDVEDWRPGTKVMATMVLSSDSGEFISTYGKRTFSVSGSSHTELAKAERTEGNLLNVKIYYYPVVQLSSPETAGWSSGNLTTAKWKSVKYATGYELRLYQDYQYVRTIESGTSSKDLSEYMWQEGDYYYEVRAVGKDRNDAKYRKSGEYTISDDQVLKDVGDVSGRWYTYSAGKQYKLDSGTLVKNQWQKIRGKWYYFDENGYVVTGWKELEGKWYYMDAEGVMLTGWQEIDQVKYYLNEDGSMHVGWLEGVPGQWYYMYPDGSMAVNTIIEGWSIGADGLTAK